MRFLKGQLGLLSLTNGGGICVASWHSRHSMTWRWALYFSPFRADEGRVWPLAWTGKGQNKFTMRVPFVGFIRWSTQEPMWYCEYYYKALQERDEIQNRLTETLYPRPTLMSAPEHPLH